MTAEEKAMQEQDTAVPAGQDGPLIIDSGPVVMTAASGAGDAFGPAAPVETEPGCQHADCVLDHPHAGPAVLAGEDGDR